MKNEDPTDRAVSRFVVVALIAPALFAGAGLAVVGAVADRLPDPIAIHWSANGQADGFAGVWTVVMMTILVGAVLPIVLAAGALPALRRGERGPSYRFLGAVVAGISALVVVLLVWSVVMQVDLADATDAPDVWAPLLGSFAAAAVVGLLAWVVQPRQNAADLTRRSVDPLNLEPGERAVWMRETTVPRLAATFLIALTLGSWALALLLWWSSASTATLVGVLITAGVVTAAAATTLTFRVRADERGLHVVSALGLPRLTVAPDDIAGVDVVEVTPMGDFGGYGLRFGPGRFGVITRSGEAIEVHRRRGRSFVVTVDDAATGAAVLGAERR